MGKINEMQLLEVEEAVLELKLKILRVSKSLRVLSQHADELQKLIDGVRLNANEEKPDQ